MSPMKTFAAIFILAAALVASVAASAAQFSSSHVADLGKDFDEKVGDGKLYFVKFYAPWCGHCKRLAPAWSELGQSFESDSDIVVAHVDCTKAKKVCTNAKIGGYPTLKLFFDGEEQETYRGGRDLPSMKEFIKVFYRKQWHDLLHTLQLTIMMILSDSSDPRYPQQKVNKHS